MEQLVLMIVIGLFLLVNAIIKKALSSKNTAGKNGQKSSEYKASTDDIEEFLEENLSPQRKSQKAQKKNAQQRSRAGQTIKTKRTDPTALSTQEQAESQKYRKRHSPKKPLSGKNGIVPDNAKRKELSFTTKDMQHAVIMSEIFRPPVALRGSAGHTPPFLRK